MLALRLLEESYPRELARILELALNGIQQALRSLELDGLIVLRTAGRTRLVRLNPRYFAYEDLQRYLLTLSGTETELRRRVATMRRRPRRTGKEL